MAIGVDGSIPKGPCLLSAVMLPREGGITLKEAFMRRENVYGFQKIHQQETAMGDYFI